MSHRHVQRDWPAVWWGLLGLVFLVIMVGAATLVLVALLRLVSGGLF